MHELMMRTMQKSLLAFLLATMSVGAQERSSKPSGFEKAFEPGDRPVFLLSQAGPEPSPASRKVEFPRPVPAPKPIESSLSSLTNIPLKMVLPGIFELGSVRMDKRQRSVSFPGSLNMASGPLEYLLVAKWGKTHESVLRTEVEPFQIHVAILLLADGASIPTNNPSAAPGKAPGGGGQFISNPSKETMPGDKVTIDVSWEVAGKRIQRRAEELVLNLEKHNTMTNATWVYNASRIWDGKFMAQLSGSIVSLVSDPDAQINSMTVGHDNDRIWNVNTNAVPGLNTPLQITIRFEETKGK